MKSKKELKTDLALNLIHRAKKDLNQTKFSRLPATDYVINSKILEFKTKFVFPSKVYKLMLEKYKKGLITLVQLKAETQKIFIENLKECENDEIDSFFNIYRGEGKQNNPKTLNFNKSNFGR